MALLYQATLAPSKMELLRAWVPTQPWLGDVDASTLEVVGAYRFDDPDGEVGIETHLLRTADGRILQVPLTYRGSPLASAELSLISTTQHSVLGERWVYDACGDPVYVRALASAILRGGAQAELDVVTDAGLERRHATTRVSGSGSPDSAIPSIESVTYSSERSTTVVRSRRLELILFRVVDPGNENGAHDGAQGLVGTWPGHDTPTLLALVRVT